MKKIIAMTISVVLLLAFFGCDYYDDETVSITFESPDSNGLIEYQAGISTKENAARMAAGGIYSSSSELTKLARCVLNNGKSDTGSTVISESSMEEMKKIHAFAGKEAYTYYGLTMMRLDKDGEEYYGHLGSAPPYSSSLYVHPRSGYGVITLINTEVKNEVRLEIPQIIFSEL